MTGNAETWNTLAELTRGLGEGDIGDFGGIVINRIETDSRRVRSGDLFVALAGTEADGHDYLLDAVNNGASAVVTERPVAGVDVPGVTVHDARKALAEIAARFYGRPADALFKCGVTGTNGKTSVSFMYRSIMEASGWGRMGIVGTLGHGCGDELVKTVHTTPDQVKLHGLFREMVDSGCRGVVMEVSSHAVRQHRAWGLEFDVGILTNVTHDHLDYHKTIDDYRAAKREFCESLENPRREKPAGILVFSDDDPVARQIGRSYGAGSYAVSVSPDNAGLVPGNSGLVSAAGVKIGLDGTSFDLCFEPGGRVVHVDMKLLGGFCATNAAFAAAAATAAGRTPEEIRHGLERLDRIPGRFEAIGGSGKPVVIVDYCHTPDAMERVLETCRGLGPRRLYTVFGCGGDRDRAKRPEMGRIAQALSDSVVLTTDNPRSEPVEKIVDEIIAGMDAGSGGYRVELDRGRAIQETVGAAGSEDVVALLGKGAENSQIIGPDRLPFSDRSEAEIALRKWKPV